MTRIVICKFKAKIEMLWSTTISPRMCRPAISVADGWLLNTFFSAVARRLPAWFETYSINSRNLPFRKISEKQ